MKYLLKYNSFENDKNTFIKKMNESIINENAAIMGAMLLYSRGYDGGGGSIPDSPEEKLFKKYVSTEPQDIEDSVPWYKFGKSKEEFIEKEKKNRKIFSDEKKRFKEECLEFDSKILVYEFFKNLPKLDVDSQQKINVLKARMNPKIGFTDSNKIKNFADKMTGIYMDEFNKMSASKLQKLETTRKDVLKTPEGADGSDFDGQIYVDYYRRKYLGTDHKGKLLSGEKGSYEELLKPRIIYNMNQIFYKSLTETNFDLEKYKPVPPTPIDPDLLKKINDYQRKQAKIEQGYKDFDSRKKEKEEREREIEREIERREKMNYDEDIKKLNKIIDNYFEKESKKVTDRNKEEIDNLLKRGLDSINSGGGSNKFMDFRYRVFKMYWDDFISKQPKDILETLKNINSDEVYTLLIGALYYKLGIDKDLKSKGQELVTKDLLSFTKYAKTRIR